MNNSNSYPKYKDSGVEWLGGIPSSWNTIPGFSVVSERKERNIGMARSKVLSLSYGKVIIKPKEKLTGLVPESFETYQFVDQGNIIIRPTDMQNDHTSLRTGLAKNRGIITSAYLNLAVLDKYCERFTHYYLHSIDTNKVIYGLGSGLRQNLDYRDFKRFPFLDIPKDEQIAIANFLDDKVGKIDAAITKKEQLIKLLNERKQITIQNAVTKGLNPDAPMRDSGIEWIGEIPEHWEVVPVKRALRIPICDGPHTTPQLLTEGVPFISAEAIKEGEIDFNKMRGYISQKDHDEFCRKYTPEVNDIYMVKSGATTGNLARNKTSNDFSIWSPLAVFRANTDYIYPEVLELILSSSFFKTGVELKWSYGTQQNIGMGVLSNLPIIIAPRDEQKDIVVHIESHSAKIRQAAANAKQSIAKLKEYKATLINAAVTGKIKVS
jgi:type I restriction enzyme, S subunit